MRVWKPKSSYRATLDGDWASVLQEVEQIGSQSALDEFWSAFCVNRLRDTPPPFVSCLEDALAVRREELKQAEREEHLNTQWLEAMARDET